MGAVVYTDIKINGDKRFYLLEKGMPSNVIGINKTKSLMYSDITLKGTNPYILRKGFLWSHRGHDWCYILGKRGALSSLTLVKGNTSWI